MSNDSSIEENASNPCEINPAIVGLNPVDLSMKNPTASSVYGDLM